MLSSILEDVCESDDISPSLFFETKEKILSLLQSTNDPTEYEFSPGIVYKNVLGFKRGLHIHMIFRNIYTYEYVWAIINNELREENDFLIWFDYIYKTFDEMIDSMVEIYLMITPTETK